MSAALLYGLVILSAIAHPVWNAMVKSSGGRTLSLVAIRSAGLVLGLAAGAHLACYALLIRSYDRGDITLARPA
jgi:hypothetical protein